MYEIKDSTIEHLTEWEFKANRMYYDSSNFPTIGIGHKIIKKDEIFMRKNLMHDILTDDEVDDLLRHDLTIRVKAINTIEQKIKVGLNQNQVDAFVLFIFNEGTIWNGLMNVVNNNANENEIRKQWTSYNTSLNKVVPGLINRRHGEVDLFFSNYQGRKYYVKAYTNAYGKIINSY
jgi:GH24 family phage-related lysozyme (muramidase)